MEDARVAELLNTLVEVTKNEFNHVDAMSDLRTILGLNSNDYRNGVSSSIHGELFPTENDVGARYKTLVMAHSIFMTANDGYDYGKQFIKIKEPALKTKCEAEAQKIAVPLYRRYLEQGLSSKNQHYDFLTLFKNPGFCEAFITYITGESFINDQLIAVYAGGSKAYPQAVAYLYERLKPNMVTLASNTVPRITESWRALLASKTAMDHWGPLVATHQFFNQNPSAVAEFTKLSSPLTWPTDDVLQPPNFPAIGTAFNSLFLQSREIAEIGSTASATTSESSYQPPGFGEFPPPPIITTIYGDDLVNWMNDQARKPEYSDIFNTGPAFYKDRVAPPFGGSCFVPGTLVQMATGQSKIEKLQAGSVVLSKLPNHYGTVSHEQVKWSVNRDVWLYGFNGEDPFFTPGHIFFTKAGPKAINPEIALGENPDVHVRQLAVGDVLIRLQGDKYIEVPLMRFTHCRASSQYVHGLHFEKGSKGTCSYHANGYLVAANYPEITIHRLTDNFASLSRREQQTFGSMIEDLPTSLRTVFGSGLVQSFEATFKEQPQSVAAQFDRNRNLLAQKMQKRHLHASHLVKSFSLVHWNAFSKHDIVLCPHDKNYHTHVRTINSKQPLPEVIVSYGAVIVDGKLVEHAKVDAKEIHWSRPIDKDKWQHGFLKTSPDGMFVHGAIGEGSHPSIPAAEAVKLTNIVPVTAAGHSNDYQLLVSSDQFSDTKLAATASYPGVYTWIRFHKIETSLSMTNKGIVKVDIVLPELDKNLNSAEDKLYTSTSAVDTANWTLNVTITVASGMEYFLIQTLSKSTWKPDDPKDTSGPPPAFHQIRIGINLATNVITGSYTELSVDSTLDPDHPTYSDGPIHAVYCPHSPKTRALSTMARNAIASSDYSLEGSPLSLKLSLYNASANIHHEPSPTTSHLATAFYSTDDLLPMNVLQTISTPADVDLHSASQNYMMAACAYWRHDDEKKLFGDESDALSKSLPLSLKESLPSDQQAFLRDHFSKTMLNYSMSRSSLYSDKFTDARKDKLQFWWTGKTSNCLSHFKEYSDLTVTTASLAFNSLIDQTIFKPYCDSTTDYAQSFFEAVTDDAILENLATSVVLGNQNLVNRYCAILNALDKKRRNFDNQLWSLVRDKQFVTLASSNPEFGKDISEFLKAYLLDLQNKIANDDPSIEKSMKEEMKADLAELKNRLDAKSVLDLAFKISDASTVLGGNILAVINMFQRRPMQNGQSNMPAFLSKLGDKLNNWPKIKACMPYLKGFIMIGMQAATLYFSISYLMRWKDLNDAQRAVAVLVTLHAVLRTVYEMVQTYKEIRNLDPKSLSFRIRCARWTRNTAKRVTSQNSDPSQAPVINEQEMATIERINPQGAVDPNVPERSTSQQIGEGGASTEAAAATKVEKTFSLSSAVVEGVMVAVNIATAVMIGIQLREEWDSIPDGIRAMDTINLVVTCAQAITGIVAVTTVVIGAELAVLPIVGALVCLAGLVMMLVEQFVPRPKPDPVQDYLNDHGYKYIDALDSSPQPQLTYDVAKTTSGTQVTLTFTVKQPANLNPTPMVKQFLVRVYAGNTEGDVFQAPTVNSGVVTANDIIWKVDGADFAVAGNNNPDANDHSLVGRVYPTTAAVYDASSPSTAQPGTSVIGSNTLTIRVTGTLNSQFKASEGSIVEILENPPKGVASTDVIWRYKI